MTSPPKKVATAQQLLLRKKSQTIPDHRFRICIETAAPNQTVFMLRKGNQFTGKRCSIRLGKIMQNGQNVPLLQPGLDLVVGICDGNILSQTFQMKSIPIKNHIGPAGNFLRVAILKPFQSRPAHIEKQLIFLFHSRYAPTIFSKTLIPGSFPRIRLPSKLGSPVPVLFAPWSRHFLRPLRNWSFSTRIRRPFRRKVRSFPWLLPG